MMPVISCDTALCLKKSSLKHISLITRTSTEILVSAYIFLFPLLRITIWVRFIHVSYGSRFIIFFCL